METLKEELVLRGAESTDIADEILLQIIKQLSGCPVWQIEVRGWALLHACLEVSNLFTPINNLFTPIHLYITD